MGLCRMIKEIAVFLFLSHCVICIDFQHDSTSVLDPGGTVRIVCDIGVANFTASVTLLKDGSPKTVCDNANTCGPSNSDSNRYQYTSNASAVTVEIFNLTQPSDDGLWTCNLGSISSANYSLTVSKTTASPTTTPTNNTTDSLKTWQIAVISAGGSLVVLALVGVTVYIVKSRRNKNEMKVEKTEKTEESTRKTNIPEKTEENTSKTNIPMTGVQTEISENTPKTETTN